MTKKWYTSKTILVNLAAAITAAIVNAIAETIQPYMEVIALAAVNLVLRAVTKEKIE